MTKLKKVLIIGLFSLLFVVCIECKAYTLPDGNIVPDIPSVITSNNYPYAIKLNSTQISLIYCTTDNFIINTTDNTYTGYVYMSGYSNCYRATTSATTNYDISSKTYGYVVNGTTWSSFSKLSSSFEFVSLRNGVVNSHFNNFFAQGLSGFNAFYPINFLLDLKNGNIYK